VVFESENGQDSKTLFSDVNQFVKDLLMKSLDNIVSINIDEVLHQLTPDPDHIVNPEYEFYIANYTVKQFPSWINSAEINQSEVFSNNSLSSEQLIDDLYKKPIENVIEKIFDSVICSTVLEV